MDRFANSLSRSLAWPLLGAALVGIPWLATRHWAPPRRDARPIEAASGQVPPGRTADEPAAPELFPLADLARLAPAAGGHPRLVLKTGFPGDDDAADDAGLLDGPALFGTPAPQPVIQAVPVDPADWPPPAEESSPAEQPTPLEAAEPMPELEPAMLLPLDEPKPRSEQLEGIARQADRHVRHGFELAGKGAYFAARAEFVAALRLLAQGLDAEHQTRIHSESLAVGLTALAEAEDFVPKGSQLEADLDLQGLIAGHRTPVLKDVDPRTLAPMLALRCYFTFAQEQLAAAARNEVAGSMALHALGKLHSACARHKTIRVRAAEPKAMTFYQAALLVFPRNYMAANDLGVLLAQAGAWPEARAAFEHSLSIQRQPAGWHNLAVVYQQLGQHELARRAQGQADMARRAETARAGGRSVAAKPPIRWVDPRTLSQTAGDAPPPASRTAAQPQPTRN